MVQIAEHLDIPLRKRNAMLLAAGFASMFRGRPYPALVRARATIERLLKAHEPYPALTVDHRWRSANGRRRPGAAETTCQCAEDQPASRGLAPLTPAALAPTKVLHRRSNAQRPVALADGLSDGPAHAESRPPSTAAEDVAGAFAAAHARLLAIKAVIPMTQEDMLRRIQATPQGESYRAVQLSKLRATLDKSRRADGAGTDFKW